LQKCIHWCEKYKIPYNKFSEKANIFLSFFKNNDNENEIEVGNEIENENEIEIENENEIGIQFNNAYGEQEMFNNEVIKLFKDE
jgi:hypothetical protein